MLIDSVYQEIRQDLVRMTFLCYTMSWTSFGMIVTGGNQILGADSFADIFTLISWDSYWPLAAVHKYGLYLRPSFITSKLRVVKHLTQQLKYSKASVQRIPGRSHMAFILLYSEVKWHLFIVLYCLEQSQPGLDLREEDINSTI